MPQPRIYFPDDLYLELKKNEERLVKEFGGVSAFFQKVFKAWLEGRLVIKEEAGRRGRGKA